MKPYNAEWGPEFTHLFQAQNYELVTNQYSRGQLRNDKGEIQNRDYYFVDHINGIDYYTPNNEDWGPIIAIDSENKLAMQTDFYEMDDMRYPDSDYQITYFNGKLVPKYLTGDQ